MINFKKVGVTALAGSLAMVAAASADVAVSGSAEVTYNSNSATTKGGVAGNPFGMTHNWNITGSGELDNGMTYSANSNFDGQDMGADSTILTLDMGDMGKLAFDQGSGGYGISTLENNVPTAYEEADHGVGVLGHGIDANGNTNVIGYSNTFSGVSLSLEINPDISTQTFTQAGGNSGGGKTGSEVNFALSGAVPGVDGLTLAVGHAKVDRLEGVSDTTETTGAINYSMGAFSVGYQLSDVKGGDSAGAAVTAYGVAFNVNENLSISYSINDNEKRNVSAVHVTEESKGYQAAYSMGSASIRLAINEADNVNGVAGDKAENTELSVSLAF